MMADYHVVAPIETFTISSGEHHPTELASLRGARLVTSIETEEGRRLGEVADQAAHRRRPDRGAVHAAGFFHLHAAVQAAPHR